MHQAGIVLCGGKSSRMGWSKAWLPFGAETMLQRVVRRLGEVVDERVVVAADDQTLPTLPGNVRVVYDRRPERGPLEGLSAGLSAVAHCDAVFVTSCDVPLLAPAFVKRMFALLGEHDVAVPHVGDFHHPLAAVYRPRVRGEIDALLAADRLRTAYLFERVAVRVVTADELRDVDPRLDSLRNLNRPDDYLTALAEAGFAVPAEVLDAIGQQEPGRHHE